MNSRNIIIGIIVGMVIISAIAFTFLPDEVPTHWNAEGEVDGTGSKWIALLLMPILSVLIYLLLDFVPRIDPRKESYEKFADTYERLKVMIIGYMFVFHIIIIIGAENSDLAPSLIIVAVSLLFILIGNEIGRVRSNFFVGLRTPWTLSSDNVWRKSNRMLGRIFVATGLVTLICAFISFELSIYVLLVLILGGTLYSTYYSYRLYREEQNQVADGNA